MSRALREPQGDEIRVRHSRAVERPVRKVRASVGDLRQRDEQNSTVFDRGTLRKCGGASAGRHVQVPGAEGVRVDTSVVFLVPGEAGLCCFYGARSHVQMLHEACFCRGPEVARDNGRGLFSKAQVSWRSVARGDLVGVRVQGDVLVTEVHVCVRFDRFSRKPRGEAVVIYQWHELLRE